MDDTYIDLSGATIDRLAIGIAREHRSWGAQAISTLVPNPAAQIVGGYGVLLGWSIDNSGGSVVGSVLLFDGEQDQARPLAVFTPGIGQSIVQAPQLPGIRFDVGLWAQAAGGMQVTFYLLRHRHSD